MSCESFYVYEHWRPDKESCFYVGKGFGNRAYCFRKNRNKHHQNVVNKLASLGLEVEVRIIDQNMTEESALQIEVERIAFWRSNGVALTNITDGGEGVTGLRHTEETKEVLRQNSLRIMKKVMADPEIRDKISRAVSKIMTRPEVRTKISKAVRTLCSNPKVREDRSTKMKAFCADPKVREDRSTKMKAFCADPKVREERSLAIKSYHQNPDNKAKVCLRAQEQNNRPEVRESRKTTTTEGWTDPEIRARRTAGIRKVLANNAELSRKKSEIMRARMADPGYAEKMRQISLARHRANREAKAKETAE